MKMDKMLKQYLDRAKEIIGKRTASEIAHDNEVVDALNSGFLIEAALSLAAQHHPSEALQWDSGNINEIATYYDYLKDHENIMKKLQMKNMN
jgi:hypothetical protein